MLKVYFFTVLNFILNVVYFQIKLKTESTRICFLTDKLAGYKSNQVLHWRQFIVYCNRLQVLFDENKAQNTFWSPYLTVFFVGYILCICYIAHGIFFIQINSIFVKLFFVTFGIELTIILLLLTFCCSRLINSNLKISKNQCSYLNLFKLKYKNIPHNILLKVTLLKH